MDAGATWAASGAMALTGRPDGPPLGAPSGVVDVLSRSAARLATVSGSLGLRVDVDGPALLGERAAWAGLRRQGDVSCGGATRLLPTADDWVAVTLARPDDIALLPAWLGVPPAQDPWSTTAAALATRAAVDVIERGIELGLPVARLGERAPGPTAIGVSPLLGHRPPTTSLPGLLVVDLSSLWAGPLCAQLLAAAGMRVVKVESTRRPDGARSGPAAFFDLLNADKESVGLDLRSADGRASLRLLLLAADVVIEASRPRALDQLGLGADEMTASGATGVWVSITGHGRSDQYGHRVGFGDDAAVAGGLVAHDERGPVFCADAVADPICGLLAAVAVLDRLTTGGRWLLDVALARVAAAAASGPAITPDGTAATPRSRSPRGRAPALGRDTAAVMSQLSQRRAQPTSG